MTETPFLEHLGYRSVVRLEVVEFVIVVHCVLYISVTSDLLFHLLEIVCFL